MNFRDFDNEDFEVSSELNSSMVECKSRQWLLYVFSFSNDILHSLHWNFLDFSSRSKDLNVKTFEILGFLLGESSCKSLLLLLRDVRDGFNSLKDD